MSKEPERTFMKKAKIELFSNCFTGLTKQNELKNYFTGNHSKTSKCANQGEGEGDVPLPRPRSIGPVYMIPSVHILPATDCFISFIKWQRVVIIDESELEFSGSSRAELGLFNSRAETELNRNFSPQVFIIRSPVFFCITGN